MWPTAPTATPTGSRRSFGATIAGIDWRANTPTRINRRRYTKARINGRTMTEPRIDRTPTGATVTGIDWRTMKEII